jgi:hypothetical protein
MFDRLRTAVVLALLLAPCPAAAASRGIEVDDAKAAAAGIRKLPPSKRLVLYTDEPSSPEIDRLPAVFDQAFPQWCEYFQVDPAEHAEWRMTGFLMKDKAKFQQAGLLPARMPSRETGYARGVDLWVYDKPVDYSRRHLLLHEGTHGFMVTVLGGMGPPWYMEGMAELLGTHHLGAAAVSAMPGQATENNGAAGAAAAGDVTARLTLNYLPASRDEVPDVARIRIIKDEFAARRAMRLRSIIDYPVEAHEKTEAYAWSWAAAVFLDRHPRYRDRFHGLCKFVADRDFNEKFYRLYQSDWQQLNEEWQVFVAGIEYGHDIPRTAIDFAPGRPLPAAGASIQVAADRGWQNSGLRLEGGTTYRLTASGRYQVGTHPKPWPCEPGGVSIRYYQGRPLGILLAAVRPEHPPESAPSALLRPVTVGLGTTLAPEQTGTLYFKINHSAAELKDCAGEMKIEVKGE